MARSHPQKTTAVLEDAADTRTGETLLLAVRSECVMLRRQHAGEKRDRQSELSK